jgi:hypothetical protein
MQVDVKRLNACLLTLEPTPPTALALVEQLLTEEANSKVSAARLMILAPKIEAALHEVEHWAGQSQRILSQCLQLQPVPHPKVPLGF